jgi:uncharacterized phage protein (TIGR02216 family)
MEAGFGILRLSPAAFWSMTLRELSAALRGRLGLRVPLTPPGRTEFERLMQRFPD